MSPPRLVALATLSLVAAGCIAPDEPGAEGSVAALSAAADHDGDPAVVAIVRAEDPTSLRCTGTLVGERIVLTAAHCPAMDDPAAVEVFFGADLSASGTRIPLLDAAVHPNFDGTADDDLALLLLAEPPPTSTEPVALSAGPDLAAPPPVSVRLVGYGVTAPDAGDDDRKRQGWGQTTEVTPEHVVLGADPSLPCNGDSGGPVFVATGEGERLGGVISRGDADCSARGRATRVDAHLEGFLTPQLDAWAPRSVPLADPCLYDDHCDSGLCLEATDEPRLRFCGQVCTDLDCPAPLTCQEGLCRHPLPSPGAVGSPCADRDDCLGGECLEEEALCSVRCVSGRGDCPTGFECAHLGGVDFFCLPKPEPSSTCNAAGTRPHDAGPLPFLGLLGLLVGVLVRTRSQD